MKQDEVIKIEHSNILYQARYCDDYYMALHFSLQFFLLQSLRPIVLLKTSHVY